ncbi:oxidoreductase [Paenibacillus filicis]|uniref:Oxidoreductase n=1 Tax=Paenibacillus gyeongsangnamensis TaxID=3388067 RepID=A0ABT4QF72_9BACL|nr:oxidoreductase [Paenibacillus filicis]MCZ8515529.1 oxidoreductase [Paenibacillus filicis]
MAAYTAIVAGATGLIGTELMRLLLQDPDYDKVIALVRRPAFEPQDKLRQIVTDWTPEDIERSLRDELRHAHVFCALGTTIKKAKTQEQFRKVDLEYPLLLGRMAAKHGASCYLLVSAMGANRRSGIFYSRVKGEVEEGLQEMGLKSLHIFRPSFLLGNRSEFRLGERVAQSLSGILSKIMVGSLRPYRPIPALSVAEGMIRAAKSGREGVMVYSSHQI